MNEQWFQGVNPGSEHWVCVPGKAKGINAHSKERAAFIVEACNGWDSLEALRVRIAELEEQP